MVGANYYATKNNLFIKINVLNALLIFNLEHKLMGALVLMGIILE